MVIPLWSAPVMCCVDLVHKTAICTPITIAAREGRAPGYSIWIEVMTPPPPVSEY